MKNLHDRLVNELAYAEKIILAMLKHMTTAQKRAAQLEIEDAGAAGDGMTRYHERRAVLMAAEAIPKYSQYDFTPLLKARKVIEFDSPAEPNPAIAAPQIQKPTLEESA